jgi:hypothetical protein
MSNSSNCATVYKCLVKSIPYHPDDAEIHGIIKLNSKMFCDLSVFQYLEINVAVKLMGSNPDYYSGSR